MKARKFRVIVNCLLMGSILISAILFLISGGQLVFAAGATTPLRALITIQFQPGSQVVREISFSDPISGFTGLEMTGASIETADYGGGSILVCSIDGVGCPADNCFCDPNHFWSYEYWDGNAWQEYLVGASQSSISDGAIEGWRWTEYGVGSLPSGPQLQAAQKALAWLAGQQSPSSGGYGSNSSSSGSLIAINANKIPAYVWRLTPESPSLLDFFMANASAYSKLGASNAGKLAVGLSSTGSCLPYGMKLPEDFYNPVTGEFEQGAGPQSWAMLGAAALNQAIPGDAISYLKGLQQNDGGWEWVPGGFGEGSDTNSTALAIQALIAAGEPTTSTEITNGLQYLQLAQNNDGGFPYNPDSPWGIDSDANSTALVIQAIYAADQNPTAWEVNSSDPISYLLTLQLANGSFEWSVGGGANLMATQQAIPAMLGRAFPLERRTLTGCPLNYLPMIWK